MVNEEADLQVSGFTEQDDQRGIYEDPGSRNSEITFKTNLQWPECGEL